MNSIFDALRPLRTAATAFFSHDVTLRRGERGLEVALAERKEADRLSPAQQRERDRHQRAAEMLQRVRDELDALLSEAPNTRRTMRALVILEDALRHEGLAALDRVPLPVLTKALEQFESLVSNWSPVGLATLRSKMAVAAQQRQVDAAPTKAPRDSGPSVSVGMQQSRQELEAAEISEIELDTPGHLLAPNPLAGASGSAAMPHPQAPTSADDEAAALAAAYAALGSGFALQDPDSTRG